MLSVDSSWCLGTHGCVHKQQALNVQKMISLYSIDLMWPCAGNGRISKCGSPCAMLNFNLSVLMICLRFLVRYMAINFVCYSCFDQNSETETRCTCNCRKGHSYQLYITGMVHFLGFVPKTIGLKQWGPTINTWAKFYMHKMGSAIPISFLTPIWISYKIPF